MHINAILKALTAGVSSAFKGIHKRIAIEKQNRRARQCREGSGAAF